MLIYAQAAETETEAKAKGKAKLNRRPAWQLLITFCVGVCVCVSVCECVCQLHVYDKPSDRQLEKRRERGGEESRDCRASKT